MAAEVKPINSIEEGNNRPDADEAQGLRVWDERQTMDSMEAENLRVVRKKFGASSKEYMTATTRVQETAQLPARK